MTSKIGVSREAPFTRLKFVGTRGVDDATILVLSDFDKVGQW